MTKKENFVAINAILNEVGHDEFDAFIAHEIELLSRKRSSSNKPTKRQIENVEIKNQIANILASADEGLTCTQIANEIGNGMTVSRVSALLRQMDGVSKEMVKGKALFSLA